VVYRHHPSRGETSPPVYLDAYENIQKTVAGSTTRTLEGKLACAEVQEVVASTGERHRRFLAFTLNFTKDALKDLLTLQAKVPTLSVTGQTQ
jgi:hypothetical protein